MNLIRCPDELLSPHFWLHEFCRSQKAEALGIDNTPPRGVIDNLRRLACEMEAVRFSLGGKAMHINSGYEGVARCAMYLDAQLPGGMPAHLEVCTGTAWIEQSL